LIITYYWPPAGGAGVQRALKFAKYLPDFGWQPLVLTLKNASYPSLDATLIKDIPDSLKEYRTNAFLPFSLYRKFVGMKKNENIPVEILAENIDTSWEKRLSLWIRKNLVVPDAYMGWIPFAVQKGLKIIHDEKPQIIFSSSPPPTVHLVAKILSKLSHLKWIADLRDPWARMYYYEKKERLRITQEIDEYLERNTIGSAHFITAVSDGIGKYCARKAGKDYLKITNGYDEEDFRLIPQTSEDRHTFRIIHTGSAGSQRNPLVLFECLSELIATGQIKKDTVEIIFAGTTCKKTQNLKSLFPEINTHFVGHLPLARAINLTSTASILLLLINDVPGSREIITAKLFNYLPLKTFILGLGPEDGEAARILQHTGAGQMVDWKDKEKLKSLLASKYKIWMEKGNIPVSSSINQYSRKALTDKLAEIYNSIIAEEKLNL